MTPMLLFRHLFAVITILMQHFVSPYYAYSYYQSCGVSSSNMDAKIIGGAESEINQWPWLAAIIVKDSEVPGTGFKSDVVDCGGSIVTTQHILTAAHCIVDLYSQDHRTKPVTDFLIRLGDRGTYTDNYVYHDVSKIVIPFAFDASSLVNDIAILKLKKLVQFNKGMQPICLPTGYMANELFVNARVIVAGWGSLRPGVTYINPRIHHVQLSVVSNDVCNIKFPLKWVPETAICAGYPPGGKDACQGDSGGPLMILIRENWYIIGVVSHGDLCPVPGAVGVYTRVTKFLRWIFQTLKL